MSMKFASDRPYSDPGTAARKLLEIANIVKPVQERLLGEVGDRPLPGR
jgi:hypothetical protein